MLLINGLKVLTNLRKINHLLKSKQITKLNLFSCSTQSKVAQVNEKSHEVSSWTPIYFFPLIRITAVCSRMKLYQTGITVTGVPWSIYMYINGLLEATSLGVISGCALIACGTLYLLSYYFRRLIGIMFLSEDETSVKISHLTFWGRKKDIIVPLEDIVPLAEIACSPTDIYIKLRRFSLEDELYFTLKYGKILDKLKFEKVFGSLEILDARK